MGAANKFSTIPHYIIKKNNIVRAITNNDDKIDESLFELKVRTTAVEGSIQEAARQISNQQKQISNLKISHDAELLAFWTDFTDLKMQYPINRSWFGSYTPFESEQEEVNAIIAAAEYGRYEVLAFLLAKCPQDKLASLLSEKTKNGNTALHLAAKNNHVKIVNLLCEYHKEAKVSLESTNSETQTAAQLAYYVRNEETLDALVKQGANFDQLKTMNENALKKYLFEHVSQNNIDKALQILDDEKILNNIEKILVSKTSYGDGLLHVAVINAGDDLSLVKKLVDLYKNQNKINQLNATGKTALHIAAMHGKTEIVDILIQNGASKDLKDSSSKTYDNYQTEKEEYDNRSSRIKPDDIVSFYKTAYEKAEIYHSTHSCAIRRIDNRIRELSSDSDKFFCFTKNLKQMKIKSLKKLSLSIEKNRTNDVSNIVNTFKTDNKREYDIMVSGWASTKTSALVDNILGPSTAQGEDHDHKFLIERNAAYDVCVQLINQLSKNNPVTNSIELKLITGLTQLKNLIANRDYFHLSVKQVLNNFKNDNGQHFANLNADTKYSCKQLISKLETLNECNKVTRRDSMEFRQQ